MTFSHRDSERSNHKLHKNIEHINFPLKARNGKSLSNTSVLRLSFRGWQIPFIAPAIKTNDDKPQMNCGGSRLVTSDSGQR